MTSARTPNSSGVEPVDQQVETGNPCAALGEQQGGRQADPRSTSGDDGNQTVESSGRSPHRCAVMPAQSPDVDALDRRSPSSTTSPARRYGFGSGWPMATPAGVPVLMTSPGRSTMNWLMYRTTSYDAENHVRGGPVLPQLPVHPEPQPECLRVGDLVGGHQPRTERVERLAALALVPLAAAFELELPLGDVVGDGVAGDARERASASLPRYRAVCPITTASSTSQSVFTDRRGTRTSSWARSPLTGPS